MSAAFPITLAPRILFRPREVFARIASNQPSAGAVFFQYALWLGLAPANSGGQFETGACNGGALCSKRR